MPRHRMPRGVGKAIGRYPERSCVQCGRPFRPYYSTVYRCSRACYLRGWGYDPDNMKAGDGLARAGEGDDDD